MPEEKGVVTDWEESSAGVGTSDNEDEDSSGAVWYDDGVEPPDVDDVGDVDSIMDVSTRLGALTQYTKALHLRSPLHLYIMHNI